MHFLFRDVNGPPDGSTVVPRLPPLAQRVGLSRRLDLDDLRPHIPEEPTSIGTCKHMRQLCLDHLRCAEIVARLVGIAGAVFAAEEAVGHGRPPEVDCCSFFNLSAQLAATPDCASQAGDNVLPGSTKTELGHGLGKKLVFSAYEIVGFDPFD